MRVYAQSYCSFSFCVPLIFLGGLIIFLKGNRGGVNLRETEVEGGDYEEWKEGKLHLGYKV